MSAVARAVVAALDAMRERPHVLRAAFFGALVLFVLFDVFAPRHGGHFVGDRIRGFWALFALAGCVGMAKLVKGVAHLWLEKPVDFYDRKEEG